MKLTYILSLLTLGAASASASIVFTSAASRPTVGVPYAWAVTLAGTDAATGTSHAGAWSWEDNALFGPGDPAVGWTHTSEWVQLQLIGTTSFTVRLERQANVSGADPVSASMFPSFTIWNSWDIDGAQDHTYNNTGNVAWAEDITYIDHIDNSTLTFVEKTYSLAPGNYTLALGSNAPATDPARQGYALTITSIPEVSTSLLGVLGGLGLLFRRKR